MTDQERDRLGTDLDREIASWLRKIAVETGAPDDFRQGVMDGIARLPRSRARDALDWLLRPRTVRFTPALAGGVAVAGLVSLFLLRGTGATLPDSIEPRAAETSPPVVAAVRTTDAVVTRFVFVAPDASSVSLAGDWIGWGDERIALRELRGSGVWTVDVPVPPGVHEYSFVIDGTEWRPDPLAGSQADDGFGRVNSILMVSAQEA